MHANKIRRGAHKMKENLRSQILGGQLHGSKNVLSGNYRGYYITFEMTNASYVVKVNASSPSDEKNAQLGAFLLKQKEEIKGLLDTQVYDYCLVLNLKAANLLKNMPGIVNGIVEPVLDYLMNYGYVSGCEQCGNTAETLSCYEINGGYHFLCSSCTGSIEDSLRQNQQNIKAQKSNFAAGLIGAFLGSLIGCVLWILIYKLGYIAGIAGAVTAICAMKGYEMLGGHLDKKGVIGSVIIMLISIFLANKIAWSWEAYDALKEYGYTFFDCFRVLGDILSESGLTGSYYGDLAIGYLLTIVCSFRNIKTAFKASSGDYTINKLQ